MYEKKKSWKIKKKSVEVEIGDGKKIRCGRKEEERKISGLRFNQLRPYVTYVTTV